MAAVVCADTNPGAGSPAFSPAICCGGVGGRISRAYSLTFPDIPPAGCRAAQAIQEFAGPPQIVSGYSGPAASASRFRVRGGGRFDGQVKKWQERMVGGRVSGVGSLIVRP